MHTYTIVLKVICKISAFLFFLVQNSPRRIIGSAPQTPRKEKRPKRKGFLALLRKRLKSKRSRTSRECISMPSHELSSCKLLFKKIFFFSDMTESRIILKIGFVGKRQFFKAITNTVKGHKLLFWILKLSGFSHLKDYICFFLWKYDEKCWFEVFEKQFIFSHELFLHWKLKKYSFFCTIS